MPPAASAGLANGSSGSAEGSSGPAEGSGQADASASWRALGTLVQLLVTDPRCLGEARRLLTADLA